jgi:hypothetical protein
MQKVLDVSVLSAHILIMIKFILILILLLTGSEAKPLQARIEITTQIEVIR